MPFPDVAPGDIVRFQVVCDLWGQEIVHSLYLRQRAARSVADIVTEFEGGASTELLFPESVSLSIQAYRVADIYPGVSPQLTFLPTGGAGTLVGNQAGVATATGLAAVASLRTPFRGQGERGRIYYAGIPPNAYAEGKLTDVYFGDVQTHSFTLVSYYNYLTGGVRPGDRSDMVLWRKHLTGVPNTHLSTPDTFFVNPITGHTADHKPIYLYPPAPRGVTPNPFAACLLHDTQANRVLTEQRRRNVGVHITRSHRV